MATHRCLAASLLAVGIATSAVATAQPSTPSHPGRLLASNCFQCHGTNGRGGFESLAGKSAREIYSELIEMRAERPGNDIMRPHALGYTEQQLQLIADYFSRMTRSR